MITSRTSNLLIFHALAIYLSYTICGYYQEKLATVRYNGEIFSYFMFLTMVQNFVNMLISLKTLRGNKVNIKCPSPLMLDYFKCAFLKVLSANLSYVATKKISYPMLIISKSCKIIPVLLMNYVLYKKKFKKSKYLTAFLLTIGVLIFSIYEKNDYKGTGSFLGMFMVFSSLIVDGVINSTQDFIFSSYSINSTHMMFYLSAISVLISFVSAGFSNEIVAPLVFISKNFVILRDIVLMIVSSVIGQAFIYSTLEKFGSLTLNSITVTRKMLSILLSIYFYGHSINFMQCIGLCFICVVFVSEIFEKRVKKVKE